MASGTVGIPKPGSPGLKQAPAELEALTGVRFFAAIFVVLYHYDRLSFSGAPWPVQNAAGTGYIAVGFFFVLSGFVLAYSYINRAGMLRGSAGAFWAARIARIYPAYLTAFLLIAPFNIYRTMHANHSLMGMAKLVVGGSTVLALLQAWTPWSAWYWNFPAWSLSVEMFFYLAFPLIVPLAARLTRVQCARLLPVLWFAGLIVPAAFVSTHIWTFEPPFNKIQMAIEVTPLMRFPEFVFGVLLGRLFALDANKHRAIGGFAVPAAIVAIIAVLAYSDAIPRPLLANGLMAPLFGIVIYALAQGRGIIAAFLSTRWLLLMGDASYAIYILQYPMASIFNVQSDVYTPVRTACYFVCLVLASIACFRFVESPLRPRIRRALAGPLDNLVLRLKTRRTPRTTGAADLLEENA
jgi:peptidoglycan/LPS O-acetylase OafA/YrhL